ncbi:MAG TPA: hypothetical protein VEP89_08115 [Draconibacterium sp.]|nr:hypothetical protein [Draconibacterium sp.]
MKKLVFLLTAVIVTAFSSSVFAQAGSNSGEFPSVGSTHSYWVNSGDDGVSQEGDHEGNSYRWWVSNDVVDLTSALSSGTYFTTDASYYNSSMQDSFAIELSWTAASVGDTFYVVVEETGNCTNIKALPVVPTNDFEVQFVALDADGNPGDSLSRCAPDIALSASGLTVTYDYGKDTAMFKIAATGIYGAWSISDVFDLAALNAPTKNIEYQIGNTGWTSNASTVNVPANSSGTEEVYFRVAFDNETSNEGLAEQTIKLTLTNVTDGNNNAKIVDADNVEFTGDAVQVQTIEARPSTSGIESN